MTSRDFCYWLQGFFEIHGNEAPGHLSEGQVDTIRKHLALVFKHEIDPSMGPPEHQAELDAIHEGDPGPAQPGASTQDLPKRPKFPKPTHGPGGGILYRC